MKLREYQVGPTDFIYKNRPVRIPVRKSVQVFSYVEVGKKGIASDPFFIGPDAVDSRESRLDLLHGRVVSIQQFAVDLFVSSYLVIIRLVFLHALINKGTSRFIGW